MSLKPPAIDGDTSRPTTTKSVSTPTRKRPDPILGRQPDSFTSHGYVDQTFEKRLDKWQRANVRKNPSR